MPAQAKRNANDLNDCVAFEPVMDARRGSPQRRQVKYLRSQDGDSSRSRPTQDAENLGRSVIARRRVVIPTLRTNEETMVCDGVSSATAFGTPHVAIRQCGAAVRDSCGSHWNSALLIPLRHGAKAPLANTRVASTPLHPQSKQSGTAAGEVAHLAPTPRTHGATRTNSTTDF